MRDRVTALAIAFAFSISLGVATVAIPLLALGAGYDPAAVGFLVAVSALAQLTTRIATPWLLGRWPDRTLIALASAVMLVGFLLLLGSTALPAFVAAQLCQGTARAIFWTASQTHAIRSGGSQVERLVDLNLSGNAGTLVGPALAGSLAVLGLPAALGAAAIGAAFALVATPFLMHYPRYDRRFSGGTLQLLRREGVDLACWASVVGGVWWSMVGSYIPVILVGAGLGSAAIGWLVTASEAAGTLALLVIRRLANERVVRVVRLGSIAELIALAGIAAAPADVAAYVALLLLGGAAAGAVTSLAAALATMAAAAQEQGDALALSGTFRAAALLAAPAGVGALLSVTSVPAAVVALALVTVAPAGLLGRRAGAPRAVPPFSR
jgi:predicted MFS family arabinose efflux permease